jgi:hypothetical protein
VAVSGLARGRPALVADEPVPAADELNSGRVEELDELVDELVLLLERRRCHDAGEVEPGSAEVDVEESGGCHLNCSVSDGVEVLARGVGGAYWWVDVV